MFDIGAPEILLIAIVAIIVIGPKDLPVALRMAGKWVGKARAMMREVRSGFDSMVREAEMEEMEKKWVENNERIMRESGETEMLPAPPAAPDSADSPRTEIKSMPDKPENSQKSGNDDASQSDTSK